MRKGSIKTVKAIIPYPDKMTGSELEQMASGKTSYDAYDSMPVRDILLRICDACHEMDNRVEPWASIRKDIEALR
jgi:hypothetical protein